MTMERNSRPSTSTPGVYPVKVDVPILNPVKVISWLEALLEALKDTTSELLLVQVIEELFVDLAEIVAVDSSSNETVDFEIVTPVEGYLASQML